MCSEHMQAEVAAGLLAIALELTPKLEKGAGLGPVEFLNAN